MLTLEMLWNEIFQVSVPAHYATLTHHFSQEALFGNYTTNANIGATL